MKHGFAGILVLIVVLVVAVGAGAYYLGTQKSVGTPLVQSPILSPSPTSTPDETASWKTYTNTTYSYSIKYPTLWIVYDSPTPGDVVFITAPDYPSTGEQIEIEVQDNNAALDWKQWAEKDARKTCTTQPCNPIINFGEEVTVGVVKTLIVSGQLPKWTQEAVYLPHADKIYIIRASSNTGKPTITQTFKKMLPTFRFD